MRSAQTATAVVSLLSILTATILFVVACESAPPGGPGSTADDDFEYIILQGREASIESAIEPIVDGGPVGAGFVLNGITIERGMIGYRLENPANDDRWVLVGVFHAAERSVADSDVIKTSPCCKMTLSHAQGVDDATAAQAAAPVLERLIANADSLKGVWTDRASHGAEPKARNPKGPEGEPRGQGPGLAKPQAPPTPLLELLTAKNMLKGVGALLLLLILFSGRPWFLRRQKR